VLIDEDHMHTPARRADLSRDATEHVFRDRRQPSRERFFALMKVNRKVLRGDRAKSKPRIVPIGGERRRATDNDRDQDGNESAYHGHEPALLPFG
jgi:hypothetical protein